MGEPWRHKPRKWKVRPIRVEGDVAYVTLTRGMVATIDAADVALVDGRNWSAQRSRGEIFYAARGETVAPYQQETVLMHRVIMGCEPWEQVDYRDRDTMNLRRKNLRIADQSTNVQNASIRHDNKSGFRGVHYVPGKRRVKPWKAGISHGRRQRELGGFATAEEAARAYDAAAIAIYGAEANLNFPPEVAP